MLVAMVAVVLGVLISTSVLTGASAGIEDSLNIYRQDGSAITFYLERGHNNDNPKTLLIAVQGSDCNSAKHDKFVQIISRRAWPSADLLLIEKRGITADLPYSADAERADCPAEYIRKDSPQQRVEDIKAVVNKILARHK